MHMLHVVKGANDYATEKLKIMNNCFFVFDFLLIIMFCKFERFILQVNVWRRVKIDLIDIYLEIIIRGIMSGCQNLTRKSIEQKKGTASCSC